MKIWPQNNGHNKNSFMPIQRYQTDEFHSIYRFFFGQFQIFQYRTCISSKTYLLQTSSLGDTFKLLTRLQVCWIHTIFVLHIELLCCIINHNLKRLAICLESIITLLWSWNTIILQTYHSLLLDLSKSLFRTWISGLDWNYLSIIYVDNKQISFSISLE